MTRHYTHVGQLAASQAIAALPSITDDKVKALKADPESIVKGIKAIVRTLTSATLADKKAELLALLA